ncbi:MAG: hypothetical protein ACOZNI_18345 [Myxococcota bacterium]
MTTTPPHLAVHPARSLWVVLPVTTGDDGTRLAAAIARARRLVPDERIVILADQSKDAWLYPFLGRRARMHVVDQPSDRGTTPAVLLALVYLLEQDPTARVIVLPGHRAIADEDALVDALRAAAFSLLDDPGSLRVVGAVEAPVAVAADGWTLAGTLCAHAPLWFGALAPATRGRGALEDAYEALDRSDFERDVLWPARASVRAAPLRPAGEMAASP